ncbi:hypothetical protein RvY_09668-2 [Ramazzottius varieornatus]|uniref:Uncharacterized protein n=1 Tax=Ramazzottius varieornatus TaxID=947166 RepID=A0A1D1VA64_RAMVA|nr:hypothetical protein RvY_09668-2 [Ramazzottius varieornatus]
MRLRTMVRYRVTLKFFDTSCTNQLENARLNNNQLTATDGTLCSDCCAFLCMNCFRIPEFSSRYLTPSSSSRQHVPISRSELEIIGLVPYWQDGKSSPLEPTTSAVFVQIDQSLCVQHPNLHLASARAMPFASRSLVCTKIFCVFRCT